MAAISLPAVGLVFCADFARADCTANGAIVTCAPPGTGGFTGNDGQILTLQPGTTVVNTGTFAIDLRDQNLIFNNGTVAVGNSAGGISTRNENFIFNNSVISAGNGGAGVLVGNESQVTNNGTITAGTGNNTFGILGNDENVIRNFGTIEVGGANATAIQLDSNPSLDPDPNIFNAGRIIAGDGGTGILAGDRHRILNSGSITAGANGIGIAVDNLSVVTNTGTIAVGAGGSAVQFVIDGNTLNNSGTIRATGSGFSIEACPCSAINNVFNNLPGGILDGIISVTGAANAVNNSGLITITDPATPIGPIPAFIIQNTAGAGAPNTFAQTAQGTLALRMDNAGAIDGLLADAVTPGGTLRVVIQNQIYAARVMSGAAAVGLTGYVGGGTITAPFGSYVSSSPFFTVTPIYTGGGGTQNSYTDLFIQLDRVPFASVPGLTPNQRAVGNALEAGYTQNLTGTAAAFYGNILAATSTGVLNQLSGEGVSAAQTASFSAGNQFNRTMLQQGANWLTNEAFQNDVASPLPYAAPARQPSALDAFASVRPRAVPDTNRWHAWGLGFGASRTVNADAASGAVSQKQTTGGGAFGVDRQIGADLLIGFAAGGSGSSFSAANLSTSGNMDGGHLGFYGVKTWGPLYVSGAINYARLDTSTTRTITGIGATETATASFSSDQLAGRIELGWKHFYTGYTVTPFAAIEPAMLWQHAYNETSVAAGGGPGLFGLNYQARSTASLPTFVGAQIDTRTVFRDGSVLSPYVRAAWVHEFEPERRLQASFAAIPSASFTVDGARVASDALRLDVGARLAVNRTLALFANLNGEFSDRGRDYAATGGVRIGW